MTASLTSSIRNGEPVRVSVVFLSDWACGTGTARHGAVDREVQRDGDGLPMLPGKAMAAMLRDAAETVASGLDEAATGLWHTWVEAIFGTQRPGDWTRHPHVSRTRSRPRPAALQARPLRLPAAVRTAISRLGEQDRRVVHDAAILIRPGVRINARTGTAADDSFRLEERAAAGLTMVADWRLRFDTLAEGDIVPWEAELLLLAAARMVRAVGGKRRRGAGRCRVDIGTPGAERGDRLSALLTNIESARTPAEAMPATATRPVPRSTEDGHDPDGTLRHRCDLRITALTPLLVARGVIGNLVLGERFVPGTSLLPTIAEALGSRATHVITTGQVVVTNATIEVDGQRSEPVPRALARLKGVTGGELVNLLRPLAGDGQRLRSASGFCVGHSGGLRVAEPVMTSRAHAVVDDERQRPNERSGGLFVYEAISAGTVLRSEVWLSDSVALDHERLAGERGIGRSRKDDYGHVRIDVLVPESDPETPDAEQLTDSTGDLVVWLLSDVLLRGDAGEPVATPAHLGRVLGEALGVSLTLPDATAEQAAAFVTTRRVESWQSRWCLPRPSLTGLAAGSVIQFRMVGTPTAEAYERVQCRGLGDRTVEGFGRLALHPDLLRQPSVRLASSEAPTTSTATQPHLDEHDQRTMDALLTQGWRRELQGCARARARDKEVREKVVPCPASPAQLGTMRTMAERLTTPGGPEAIREWIKGTRKVPRRKNTWTEDRLDRLERLVSEETTGHSELWQLLRVRPPERLAATLYLPALSWLLTEASRTQTQETNV